jgi:alkylation response protein AidB-like acyl-CoA dehydrogenase
MKSEGVKIEECMWTFNMPTDHARVSFKNVWVPDSAIFGPVDNGLVLARHFVRENRIRQAASGVGAAQYCINESVDYANTRKPFGKPLSRNQARPLVELQTECELLRWLIYRTAWEMDRMTGPEIQLYLSDRVSMCNYRGNRLVCDAADWAMQVHGGWATRVTSNSSTFTVMIGVIGSPKDRKKFRFVTLRDTCSASSERTVRAMRAKCSATRVDACSFRSTCS